MGDRATARPGHPFQSQGLWGGPEPTAGHANSGSALSHPSPLDATGRPSPPRRHTVASDAAALSRTCSSAIRSWTMLRLRAIRRVHKPTLRMARASITSMRVKAVDRRQRRRRGPYSARDTAIPREPDTIRDLSHRYVTPTPLRIALAQSGEYLEGHSAPFRVAQDHVVRGDRADRGAEHFTVHSQRLEALPEDVSPCIFSACPVQDQASSSSRFIAHAT